MIVVYKLSPKTRQTNKTQHMGRIQLESKEVDVCRTRN